MSKPKVSVVIPVYKPEKEVFNKVRDMLKKQTIKAEVIENWNMPEMVSMNTGVKKSKAEIVVILSQDCVPENKFWLERLIKPLEKKEIIATVSNLYLTEDYWKKYPFLTRILTLSERRMQYPDMDIRACAFRKKDLIKIGMFNEDPKVFAADADTYDKLRKIGKIARPGCKVFHLHSLTNKKKIKMIYNYAEGIGKIIKNQGTKDHAFLRRLLRVMPFIGIASILLRFPYKKYPLWFPLYFLVALPQHVLWVYGFWNGFFFSEKESQRNLEVLNEKNN